VKAIGPKQQDFDQQHSPRLRRNALGQRANDYPDFHSEFSQRSASSFCMNIAMEPPGDC
jgi:hypothetical protein